MLTRDFERMLNVHREEMEKSAHMWPSPFLADRFPKMRFVHVLRDARDMMLSENRYFLKQHSWSYGSLETNGAVESSRQVRGDRYYMLRYDDLCQTSAETVMRLWNFLEHSKWMSGRLSKGFATAATSADGAARRDGSGRTRSGRQSRPTAFQL